MSVTEGRCGRFAPYYEHMGKTSFSLAFVAIAIAACSSSEKQGRFDEVDPTNPGGFGTGSVDPAAGKPQCAKAEVEAQKAPVDIILSVDQSGSMNDDLANVRANINQLANFLDKTGL